MVTDFRRNGLHAAVAAGGASAALMSASVFGTDEEVIAAAREVLDPLLRAALLTIDGCAGTRGTPERDHLKRAIEDYLAVVPACDLVTRAAVS